MMKIYAKKWKKKLMIQVLWAKIKKKSKIVLTKEAFQKINQKTLIKHILSLKIKKRKMKTFLILE